MERKILGGASTEIEEEGCKSVQSSVSNFNPLQPLCSVQQQTITHQGVDKKKYN